MKKIFVIGLAIVVCMPLRAMVHNAGTLPVPALQKLDTCLQKIKKIATQNNDFYNPTQQAVARVLGSEIPDEQLNNLSQVQKDKKELLKQLVDINEDIKKEVTQRLECNDGISKKLEQRAGQARQHEVLILKKYEECVKQAQEVTWDLSSIGKKAFKQVFEVLFQKNNLKELFKEKQVWQRKSFNAVVQNALGHCKSRQVRQKDSTVAQAICCTSQENKKVSELSFFEQSDLSPKEQLAQCQQFVSSFCDQSQKNLSKRNEMQKNTGKYLKANSENPSAWLDMAQIINENDATLLQQEAKRQRQLIRLWLQLNRNTSPDCSACIAANQACFDMLEKIEQKMFNFEAAYKDIVGNSIKREIINPIRQHKERTQELGACVLKIQELCGNPLPKKVESI